MRARVCCMCVRVGRGLGHASIPVSRSHKVSFRVPSKKATLPVGKSLTK